jgi:hypothetical protein
MVGGIAESRKESIIKVWALGGKKIERVLHGREVSSLLLFSAVSIPKILNE